MLIHLFAFYAKIWSAENCQRGNFCSAHVFSPCDGSTLSFAVFLFLGGTKPLPPPWRRLVFWMCAVAAPGLLVVCVCSLFKWNCDMLILVFAFYAQVWSAHNCPESKHLSLIRKNRNKLNIIYSWSNVCQHIEWIYHSSQISIRLPTGTWCSGVTSALHAEGHGFNPQCVQLTGLSTNEKNCNKENCNICLISFTFLQVVCVQLGQDTRLGHTGDWTQGLLHAKRMWYHYTMCPAHYMLKCIMVDKTKKYND